MKSEIAFMLFFILCSAHSSPAKHYGDIVKCFFCNVSDQLHDETFCNGMKNFETIAQVIRCPDTWYEGTIKIHFGYNDETDFEPSGCFCQLRRFSDDSD